MVILAAGAALTFLTFLLARHRLPRRPNLAGRRIPTSTGLVFVPIILMMLVMQAVGAVGAGREGAGYLAYLLLAAVVGWLDDVWGGAGTKGFGGHARALLRSRLTTGMVKALALGGGAGVLGYVVFGLDAGALFAAFLLAGCANLGNLFDVRPGRAFKFLGLPICVLLFVASYEAVFAVIGVVGGSITLFYFDLKGRIMLGDAGAAVWGAVLGCLVVASGPGVVWWVAGVAILVLTAIAEFSSISRVIEEVKILRWFDLWGRG